MSRYKTWRGFYKRERQFKRRPVKGASTVFFYKNFSSELDSKSFPVPFSVFTASPRIPGSFRVDVKAALRSRKYLEKFMKAESPQEKLCVLAEEFKAHMEDVNDE